MVSRRILGAAKATAETWWGYLHVIEIISYHQVLSEIVHFLTAANDSDAMNGCIIWGKPLASHLFLHECYLQEVSKSETHWGSSECWDRHSTACVIVFCMEIAVWNNQHCCCCLEIMAIVCSQKYSWCCEFILQYHNSYVCQSKHCCVWELVCAQDKGQIHTNCM